MPVKRRQRVPALLVVVGLLGTLALVATLTSSGRKQHGARGLGESPSGFDGAVLPPGSRAPAGFSLIDQDGRRVSPGSFGKRPVVVAFMYPGCGATCVLVAEQIRGALNELSRPVPVLIVDAGTVPASRASRRRFLREVSLSGRASYLSGPPHLLRSLRQLYGVTPPSAGRAKFDQAIEVRLLDAAHGEQVVFGLEQLSPESLAHDIKRLQAGSREGG